MNAQQTRTARRVRAGQPPAPTLHRVDTSQLEGDHPRVVLGCCSHDCAEGRACQRRKHWSDRALAQGIAVVAIGWAIVFTVYFLG